MEYLVKPIEIEESRAACNSSRFHDSCPDHCWGQICKPRMDPA